MLLTNFEYFKALLSLRKISEWILSKRGANLDAKKGPHFTESSRRIRLKKIIEANNSDEAIRAVVNNLKCFSFFTILLYCSFPMWMFSKPIPNPLWTVQAKNFDGAEWTFPSWRNFWRKNWAYKNNELIRFLCIFK
jgi:hypothetical protein